LGSGLSISSPRRSSQCIPRMFRQQQLFSVPRARFLGHCRGIFLCFASLFELLAVLTSGDLPPIQRTARVVVCIGVSRCLMYQQTRVPLFSRAPRSVFYWSPVDRARTRVLPSVKKTAPSNPGSVFPPSAHSAGLVSLARAGCFSPPRHPSHTRRALLGLGKTFIRIAPSCFPSNSAFPGRADSFSPPSGGG